MQRIIKDRQVVDDRWHLLPKDVDPAKQAYPTATPT